MESHFIEMFSNVSVIDALALFIVLAALGRGLYGIVDKIHKLKTKAEKREEVIDSHEKSIQGIQENIKDISQDIKSLNDKVSGITDTLATMETQNNTTEMIRYQDRLVTLYRHYKKLGFWNELERSSFNNMYSDYVSRGGNSFVKETIKPFMETLTVKTLEQVEKEELQDF